MQSGDLIEFIISHSLNLQIKEKLNIYQKKEISIYGDYVIEDNEILVINKPIGIPVQSGTKSFKNIIDILKNTKYFKNSKPFIVHRLDKETSGVLIIAKIENTLNSLHHYLEYENSQNIFNTSIRQG